MAELNEAKQRARTMWAVGDYASIAERISEAGEKAVEAAGVTGDDEVLDVACGAGNATIPAARTGATVTGLDLTPELLDAARAAAQEAGVEVSWIEGDAENLPFDDSSFDVVMSVFGCMFAPDHKKTAEEIARVTGPDGRIAICSWTPEGNIGQFFITVAGYMPPPPDGFQPPVLWGVEDHVRGLFDGTGVELEFERAEVTFKYESVQQAADYNAEKLPPLVAAKAALEAEGRWEDLRKEVIAVYEKQSRPVEGGIEFSGEYLVARGRKSG